MDNRGLRARLESQADGSATEAERLAEVQQENSELMAAVSRKTTRLFWIADIAKLPLIRLYENTTTYLHQRCANRLRKDGNCLTEMLVLLCAFVVR